MSVPSLTPEQLIEDCQGLVRSIASSIHRKLPPQVELEDLIAYGQIGLVEAARDFDPMRGSRFSTYAYYRVRGAIYDGLAKMTWFSRSQQNQVRCEQMGNEALRLEGEEEEPAEKRTIEVDMRWLRNVTRALAVVYLATHRSGETEGDIRASSLVDESSPEGSAAASDREIVEKLHQLIEALPEEAKSLIRATYFEGLTLQEAGQRLGVSKSWASRLHAKTLQRLARSLRLEEAPS